MAVWCNCTIDVHMCIGCGVRRVWRMAIQSSLPDLEILQLCREWEGVNKN